jgi:hypothetical protein
MCMHGASHPQCTTARANTRPGSAPAGRNRVLVSSQVIRSGLGSAVLAGSVPAVDLGPALLPEVAAVRRHLA